MTPTQLSIALVWLAVCAIFIYILDLRTRIIKDKKAVNRHLAYATECIDHWAKCKAYEAAYLGHGLRYKRSAERALDMHCRHLEYIKDLDERLYGRIIASYGEGE